MSKQVFPDPVVDVSLAKDVARDVVVVPDRNVLRVPNIGIIGGTDSVLVVDTGLGPRNAEKVLAFAREISRGRRLYLTTTHFHPEHTAGSAAFAGEATFLINQAQADDLSSKGPGYLQMFAGIDDAVARELEGAEVTKPDIVYGESYDLDLGGRIVQLRATGRGHTKGDQVVRVPDVDTLFTGDLVLAGYFPVFPWFPPTDVDASGTNWLATVERLAAGRPQIVVPGHGDVGDADLLDDVRDTLRVMRDESWARQDSAMSQDTLVEEVTALIVARHPDWSGSEWLGMGIGCMCAEHQH